jgi:predicted nucleic acid-binding protein
VEDAVRIPRVYVDTSVFGGVNDDEFAVPSARFFERVRRGDFVILVSLQTIAELRDAPEVVRRALADLPQRSLEAVDIDGEVESLAEAYLRAAVLSVASRGDALHVAAATVAGADLVLSWNFKHIVRYDRVRKFNGVNAVMGYRPLDIRSPLEVEHGDEGQDL